MGGSLILLLAFLAGGGGSDLVDYISPQQYWADKQVRVTVEAMANELKPVAKADVSKLLDDLASPDAQAREDAANKIAAVGMGALDQLRQASESPIPQVAASARGLINRIESANRAPALRKLMAIRELGELKDKQAIPALRPLLESRERFVADYAAEAIDRIDGKPFHRSHPADLRQDVYLLPEGCRAVVQVMGPPGGPVNVADEIKRMPAMPGTDPAAMTQGIQSMLVSAVEQAGNFRLDGLSAGVAGDVGPNSGYVVVVARGTYDSRGVAEWLHKQQVPSNHVGGVEIFQPPGAEMLVCFPDDHHAALIGSPQGAALPTEEVVAAIKAGQGKLKNVAEMKQLIDAAPANQPIWGVARITPAYAQAPVFAPFDSIDLGSKRVNGQIALTVTAKGKNADKAHDAAVMVENGAAQAAAEARQMVQFMPSLKPVADAMANVKCQSQGGNATLTATMPGMQSGLFLLPMMTVGNVHAEIGPATQPAVPPAPVAPAAK